MPAIIANDINMYKVQKKDIPKVKQLLSKTWIDAYGSFLPEDVIKI